MPGGRRVASEGQQPPHSPKVAVVKLQHFDIVRRELEGKLLWLEDAEDLASAKTRIQELASFWPGEFDVMDQQTHQTLAKIIGPSDTQSSTS
jgi:hypothetical protein